MSDTIDWPARAYVYGTWEYAFDQAWDRVSKTSQRMFVYKGVLNGEEVWVAAWDPKPKEPEFKIDYNTIVMRSGFGLVSHTYSPNCPAGCRGQMEDCYYKKEGRLSRENHAEDQGTRGFRATTRRPS